MSEPSNPFGGIEKTFGFGKYVPGFDFLQNLAKGASQNIPPMPNLSSWVAPTLNVEELTKRIDELKAVHFWLDQNSKALSATIQALEVQKMTLATLKGMNFSLGELADAFKLKTADTGAAQAPAEKAADLAQDSSAAAAPAKTRKAAGKAEPTGQAPATPGVVDPLQWWGSLTQQFQQIAASAMKDAARQTALDTTKHMATGLAKEALKTATDMASSAAQLATKSVAPRARRTGATAKKAAAKQPPG